MRIVPLATVFALLVACGDTARDKGADNGLATSNLTTNGSANENRAEPTVPPFSPSRVAGEADPPGQYYSDRGGISRPLSGTEGGGEAANRAALVNDLMGRWAFNCNTGVGPLVFERGGRFTAPGGSGRFQARGHPSFEIIFTFEEGDSETWVYNMMAGQLGLERRGGRGSISRRLCSATP